MRTLTGPLILIALLLTAPLARAQEAGLSEVLSCRTITDPGQRLDCFDKAAGALQAAQAAGEVQVITRAEVEKVRRDSFGFNIPSLPAFTSGVGNRAEKTQRVTEPVTSVVSSGGRLRITLANGSVWVQIDDKSVRARNPVSAEIFEAALGSYKMKLDGGLAFRVRREK